MTKPAAVNKGAFRLAQLTAMLRRSAPATANPPPVEWHPAVLKSIQTATSDLQVAEAKRMGSALAGMQKKEAPTVKDAFKPAKPVR